jgi:UDP-N-acetylbacillosamine N-acetyltransferase
METGKLLILGFGGHARSVADVALSCGFTRLVFVEASTRGGEDFCGHPVVPGLDPFIGSDWPAFPAAGDNRDRSEQYSMAAGLGFAIATLVSPRASVGAGATVGAGCLVAHLAHVGPMARLGLACIINTAAVVEHECEIGDFCHVSVNAAVAGRTRLGQFITLGAGATAIDRISICDDVLVGAGAVVTRPIEAAGTYIGVPARKLERSAS